MSEFPTHYRYRDSVSHEGLLLIEERFYPIRETECFYFILPEWQFTLHKRGVVGYENRATRVSKKGLRRKCYPSKEQAFESYLIRKKRQIWHAKDALNRASLAVESLGKITNPEELKESCYSDSKIIGHAPFIDDYIFE